MNTTLPLFVVIEDGHEYVDRFSRLLGERFRFVRAAGFAPAHAIREEPIAAWLLDLDFRRLAPEALVDEAGRPGSAIADAAALQGIYVLRALRAHGDRRPALLFADLDDPEQERWLTEVAGPVEVIGSRAGIVDIAARLARLAGERGR